MKRKLISILLFMFLLPLLSIGTSAADIQGKKIIFVVDRSAEMKLYEKPEKDAANGALHYVPFTEIVPEETESGQFLSSEGDNNIYTRYVFDISEGITGAGNTNYSYRVTEEGKLTQAGWINKADICDPLSISSFHNLTNPENLNNDNRIIYDITKNSSGYTDIYFDDGILINANKDGSSSINLQIGETFQLKAYRSWQITEGTNYFIEPDFHFERVLGDSVFVDQKGIITAKKEGFSVIRITYDAINVGYLDSMDYYNATDPICVGIVAVTVGGKDDSTLKTGIELKEYDTIYFDEIVTEPSGKIIETGKTYAEYSFTPSVDSSVEVLEAPELNQAFKGRWSSEWTSYEPDSAGCYTVRLKPGKSIIKVSKGDIEKYHVVRAAGLGIHIKNQSEPGNQLAVGDIAEISFEGLYLPVPKMAAVYNPGLFSYSGTVYPCIEYTIDGVLYKGTAGQYNIRNRNTLYVEAEEEGDYLLKNGQINEGYMGSNSITHYNIPETGLIRNFSAVGIQGKYSQLPEIPLHVLSAREVPDKKKNQLRNLNITHNSTTKPFIIDGYEDIYLSIDRPGEDYDKNTLANVSPALDYSTKELVYTELVGGCYHKEVTVFCRYKIIGEDKYYIKSSDGASFDFTLDGFEPKNETQVFAELIIVPKDKGIEPDTHSFLFYYSIADKYNVAPYLRNLTPIQEPSENYEEEDGLLISDPIDYLTQEGEEKELAFGRGFLTSENNYSMLVPDSVTSIRFDTDWIRPNFYGSNEYTKAVITVDGNEDFSQELHGPGPGEENSVLTDPIPLNPEGDSIIRFTLTSTESIFQDVTNVYTIRVSKHGKIARRKVVFTCPTEDISLTIKNEAGKKMTPDETGAYNLIDGSYSYTASVAGYRTLTGEFTVVTSQEGDQIVEIPALEGPRSVAFTFATQKTELVIKNAKNKLVEPENGVYLLIGGDTYTYYASAKGYLTRKESFVVGDEENQTISIPALEEAAYIPRGSKATVTIVTDEKKLINDYAVPMNLTDSEMDLVTGKNYVEYNLGTYTALHALIYALDDDQGVDYTCRKGKLKVITDMGGTYPKGSWVCEVNGHPVADPWLYPLSPNDKVLLYYNKGYEGMTHALFTEPLYEVPEGDSVTLTLYGHPVGEGSDESVLDGATIYVNGREAGSTDSAGAFTLKDLTMAGGPYVVTAKKFNDNGENILTWNQSMIAVQSRTDGNPSSNTVRFRLIGDKKHGDSEHTSYETWIATEEIPLKDGTNTVCDIFLKAITSAGLEQSGAENGYVRMIQAPASLGGYTLSEFDNGSSSGWMYTLNGIHPQYGVLEQNVEPGDNIVFHYVDNFHIEENNYTWLEALDENPPGIIPYAVKAVADQMNSLPAASGITLKDKAAVEAARKAYNALSSEQKSKIDAATLKKLTDAEARIAQLSKAEETKKKASVVKVGQGITVGNLNYKVTSVAANNLTVKVTGMKDKNKASVTIPATITIEKGSYKVTLIDNNAFKGSKKLKTVTIGTNVNTIGKKAFASCKKLKKITIKSTVLKKVGAGSLKGIHKKAVIKVPAKKLKAYKKLFKKKGQAKTVKIKK